MTPTIETDKRVAMLAIIGGIGATVALLIAASRNNGFTLSLDPTGVKSLWEVVTAGVFWATIFNWLFEKWLWRLSILQGWLIKVPELSGDWEGTSESRFFKDKNGAFQSITVSAHIEHRFDRIIYTQKGLALSTALVADLSTDENGACTLTVVYYNHPQPAGINGSVSESLATNIREHYGCARMVLNRPPKERTAIQAWTLRGNYWTSKSRFLDHEDRGTTGVIELHRKC